MRVEIAPSILSADFARLGDQVAEVAAAGADRIHIDVMDGHFVPNLTMGPAVLAAVRRVTRLPLEAHLMIEQPERFIEAFAEAGADIIQVQPETTYQLHRVVTTIRRLGKRVAVAFSPATPVEALTEILAYVDQVNVMTVEPGFGGQAFIATSPAKIRRVRELAPELDIEVDGGVDADTCRLVTEAGANVLVAGSFVFGHRDGAAAGMRALRAALGGA